jgi:hypothetical protein
MEKTARSATYSANSERMVLEDAIGCWAEAYELSVCGKMARRIRATGA